MAGNSASVELKSVAQTLILPLRLSYGGRLRKDWRDSGMSAARRMARLAGWIAGAEGSCWEADPDLYASCGLFGGGAGGTAQDHADEARRYATALYFHPFIRELLFSKGGPPVFQVLRHAKVRGVRMQATRYKGTYQTRAFAVDRCHLFLFPCNVAVLAVGISREAGPELPLLLPEAQDLLNQFRRLYPPFYHGDGETPGEVVQSAVWMDGQGKAWDPPSNYFNPACFRDAMAAHRQPPMAAHWKGLLAPLAAAPEAEAGKDGVAFHQVVDDRIPSMVFAALDRVEDVSEGDFARLLFLDSSGDAARMPYSPAFLGDLKEFRYDRYWLRDDPGFTTRFLCCGYNFGVIVSANNDFAPTLRAHFERHYFFMGLLVWLHKAALLNFWWRLADIVKEFSGKKPNARVRGKFVDDEKWLLSDLSDFVTGFYFSEVSNQVQGEELFSWWAGHLKTPELYGQVMEQAKFLREVQMSHWQEEMQKQSARLQRAANAWLPVSVLLALLGFESIHIVNGWVPGTLSRIWLNGALEVLTAVMTIVSAGSICWFLWQLGRDGVAARGRND